MLGRGFSGKSFNPESWKEVYAVANKGYTAGFLKGNPGKSAQKYDGTKSEQTSYRFAGIIRGYDLEKKLLKVEPRNPLFPGQNLELITKTKTIPFKIDKLYDDKFEPIDKIHGGLQFCHVPYPEPVDDFCLIREPVSNN